MMKPVLRAIYQLLRDRPLIGPMLVALRQRRARKLELAANLKTIAEAFRGDLRTQLVQRSQSPQASELRQLIAELGDRLEFVRQELFYEMRALTRADFNAGETAPTPARIISHAKLEAQRHQGGLRLNIGCGHRPDPDRINLDLRELPGVDVIAAADALPFQAGEVQEIFSSHVLEHFPIEALRRSVLPAWVSCLRPGGQFRAIVPDAEAMIKAHASGDFDFERLRQVTFGAQEYSGDFHHTMFTPASLCALLGEAGLVDVRIEAAGRPNGLCLECEVLGTKP